MPRDPSMMPQEPTWQEQWRYQFQQRAGLWVIEAGHDWTLRLRQALRGRGWPVQRCEHHDTISGDRDLPHALAWEVTAANFEMRLDGIAAQRAAWRSRLQLALIDEPLEAYGLALREAGVTWVQLKRDSFRPLRLVLQRFWAEQTPRHNLIAVAQSQLPLTLR